MFSRQNFCVAIFLANYFLAHQQANVEGVNVVSAALSTKKVYDALKQLEKSINHETRDDKIFSKFRDLSNTMQNFKQNTNQSLFLLSKSITSASSANDFHIQMLKVRDAIIAFQAKLMPWQHVPENHLVMQAETITKMADGALSYGSGIPTDLAILHLLMTGDHQPAMALQPRSLTQVIVSYFEENREKVCELRTTVQQAMLEFYESVQMLRIRGATMANLAWKLLETHRNVSFRPEMDFFNEHFHAHSVILANVWEPAMRNADRSLWRCDPDRYVENETYAELTNLERGYIQHELGLKGCLQSCDDFQSPESDKGDQCDGERSKCKFIGKDLDVTRDSAKNPVYIQNSDGQSFGKPQHLISMSNVTEKLSSHRRPAEERTQFYYAVGIDPFMLYRCDYCLCLCRNEKAENSFSLLPVQANYDSGRYLQSYTTTLKI